MEDETLKKSLCIKDCWYIHQGTGENLFLLFVKDKIYTHLPWKDLALNAEGGRIDWMSDEFYNEYFGPIS